MSAVSEKSNLQNAAAAFAVKNELRFSRVSTKGATDEKISFCFSHNGMHHVQESFIAKFVAHLNSVKKIEAVAEKVKLTGDLYSYKVSVKA